MTKKDIFKELEFGASAADVKCYPLVTSDRSVFKLCANGHYVTIPYRRVVSITYSSGCLSVNLTKGGSVKVFSSFNSIIV